MKILNTFSKHQFMSLTHAKRERGSFIPQKELVYAQGGTITD